MPLRPSIRPLRSPEVVDFNYPDVYRLESDYTPAPTSDTWAFAITGQSLAEGGVGGDFVEGLTPYPASVEMLSRGPVGLNTVVLGGITTLAESSRVTIATSMMRAVLNESAPDYQVFHGQAWGGKNYDNLKKGGASGVYERVLAQVATVFERHPEVIYKAVCCIHGEQDALDNNTSYATNLASWQTNFETDILAAIGKTGTIPMLICQTSSSSGYGYNGGISQVTFPSPLQQLAAHIANDDIYLVCPKYFLPYYDHAHITNEAQRILGEYYAKAFASLPTWEPLRPSSIVGSGSTITVSFVGRVGDLAFDTTLVEAATNYGFAYQDDSSRTITNVAIVGDTVVITLSGAIGTTPILGYAHNNGLTGAANQVLGLGSRGNLRDTDTAVSAFDGAPLYNWCVHFRQAVTV